jgi:hypothetical protein
MGLIEKAAYYAGRGYGRAKEAVKDYASIPQRTVESYKEGWSERSGKDYDTYHADKARERDLARAKKQEENERKRLEEQEKKIKAEEARIKREEATQAHRRKVEEHRRKELNIQRKHARNLEIARGNQRRIEHANRPINQGGRSGAGGYGRTGGSLNDRMARLNEAMSGRGASDLSRRMRDMDDAFKGM